MQHLLLLASMAIFLIAGIFIFKFGQKFSGFLITLGSSSILFIQIMQLTQFSRRELTPNELQQPYIAVELSIWNKTSFWVDPIGVFLVSLGVFILAYYLKTLNKQLQPIAVAPAE